MYIVLPIHTVHIPIPMLEALLTRELAVAPHILVPANAVFSVHWFFQHQGAKLRMTSGNRTS
jgi:hypothetical protein